MPYDIIIQCDDFSNILIDMNVKLKKGGRFHNNFLIISYLYSFPYVMNHIILKV